jgi:hypothetical protein
MLATLNPTKSTCRIRKYALFTRKKPIESRFIVLSPGLSGSVCLARMPLFNDPAGYLRGTHGIVVARWVCGQVAPINRAGHDKSVLYVI